MKRLLIIFCVIITANRTMSMFLYKKHTSNAPKRSKYRFLNERQFNKLNNLKKERRRLLQKIKKNINIKSDDWKSFLKNLNFLQKKT